jgi:hypothetical protein
MVYKTGTTTKIFTGTGTSSAPIPIQDDEAGDMTIVPDPTTAFMDPFAEVPTLCFICDIRNNDGTPFDLDPRYVARKAEKYLSKVVPGGSTLWGPELEFYLFDEVRYHSDVREAFYRVDSAEAYWNAGKEGAGVSSRRGARRIRPGTGSATSAHGSCSTWKRSASRSSTTTTSPDPPARWRSRRTSPLSSPPGTTSTR